MYLSEREMIQEAISTAEGVECIAQVYAEFLSMPEYPDDGKGIDWEIIVYSYLDLKKAGFWDKISLESFFETHGTKIGTHARKLLLWVKSSPQYA